MLTLMLNTQSVVAEGTIYIRADGSVDPPEAPIQHIGDIYTFISNISLQMIVVQRSNILIDGAGHTLLGTGLGTRNGIHLKSVMNVTIINTNVRATYAGIYLDGTSYVILHGNNISESWSGIKIVFSSNNSIYENYITLSENGIELFHSSGNNISRNGIGSPNGQNSYGIAIVDSSNNLIYNNDFVNNLGSHVYTENSVNAWDNGYPSGGNYWSDYGRKDAFFGRYQNLTGSDGIGDAAYTIDKDNSDHYPLMSLFKYWSNAIFGDVNKDMIVDINDISQLYDGFGSKTGSEGYYWHSPLCILCPHCPNLDIDKNNRIDMTDIIITVTHFNKHYP
jgi:parallel beta-helix repeat protein